MKFGKVLQTTQENLFPEMGAIFLRYKQLKKTLKSIPAACEPDGTRASGKTSASASETEAVQGTSLSPEELRFLGTLNEDLAKFNQYFIDKEEESVIRLQVLSDQVASAAGDQERLSELKPALVNAHGEMVLLLHWSLLNYAAVVKILKKHDKRSSILLRAPYLANVLQQPFASTTVMSKLVKRAEELVQATLSEQQLNVLGCSAAAASASHAMGGHGGAHHHGHHHHHQHGHQQQQQAQHGQSGQQRVAGARGAAAPAAVTVSPNSNRLDAGPALVQGLLGDIEARGAQGLGDMHAGGNAAGDGANAGAGAGAGADAADGEEEVGTQQMRLAPAPADEAAGAAAGGGAGGAEQAFPLPPQHRHPGHAHNQNNHHHQQQQQHGHQYNQTVQSNLSEGSCLTAMPGQLSGAVATKALQALMTWKDLGRNAITPSTVAVNPSGDVDAVQSLLSSRVQSTSATPAQDAADEGAPSSAGAAAAAAAAGAAAGAGGLKRSAGGAEQLPGGDGKRARPASDV